MTNHSQTQASQTRARGKLKKILLDAFRVRFPQDTVDVSDGYKGNIHVVVVSRAFDSLTEKQKQNELWKVIDDTDLTKAEKQLISLVYPVSVAELK